MKVRDRIAIERTEVKAKPAFGFSILDDFVSSLLPRIFRASGACLPGTPIHLACRHSTPFQRCSAQTSCGVGEADDGLAVFACDPPMFSEKPNVQGNQPPEGTCKRSLQAVRLTAGFGVTAPEMVADTL